MSEILQFIVDELRRDDGTLSRITVNNRADGTIVFDRDGIEELQKILNTSDFIESITNSMMKQVSLGVSGKKQCNCNHGGSGHEKCKH